MADNYQRANAGAPPPQAPGAPYRFTPEEMAVLNQCNEESFFQRSLPLGTLLGVGTFAAVQRGYLKPNAKFGAFPKVSLAVIVGYFLGKVSYQRKCAEKLMALPGSYIGQILREKREGKISPGQSPSQYGSMYGATSGDIYSDAGPGSSLNLDLDRPSYDSDTYRPDNGPISPDPPAKSSLSYDELRKSNRDKYYESRQDPYRVTPPSAPARVIQPESPPPAPRPTNKYGDVID